MARKPRRNNKMLSNVLQAISELKEARGVTIKQIVEKVNCYHTKGPRSGRPRNLTLEIKRALKDGVENGLVQLKSGKYKLLVNENGESSKRSITSRMKKQVGRGSASLKDKIINKRKRKASSSSSSKSETEFSEESESESSHSENINCDEIKIEKRGKKPSKRRKVRSVDQNLERIESCTGVKIREINEDSGDKADEASKVECSNPDCLCNLKKEEDDNDQENDPSDDENQQENFPN